MSYDNSSSHSPGSRSFLGLMKDPQVLSWAFYDWGNSAFATTVMAGFFPIFFKQYWTSSDVLQETAQTAIQSTALLGYANSISSLVLGLTAPLLGALADKLSAKKKLLFSFTFLGAVASSALALAGKGEWQLASLLYILAGIGFWGGQNFYDALLTSVAKKDELDHVSGLGYSLGYLGGGLLFALNVFMTLQPETFGLSSAADAVRISFVMVGVWWLVFSIPLFINVKEEKLDSPAESITQISKDAFLNVVSTFKNLKQYKAAFTFLIGYFFFIDGVNTIIKMAVDYGIALGFQSESLIKALLLVQFIGFPATIGFSFLAQKIGGKTSIMMSILIYALITILATQLEHEWHFYTLAGVIGLIQGGIQALSRSYFGSLIPLESCGEFFGFFNLLGRFSAILGPLLIAITGLISNNSRVSMLSLLILFAMGAWIVSKVNPNET